MTLEMECYDINQFLCLEKIQWVKPVHKKTMEMELKGISIVAIKGDN